MKTDIQVSSAVPFCCLSARLVVDVDSWIAPFGADSSTRKSRASTHVNGVGLWFSHLCRLAHDQRGRRRSVGPARPRCRQVPPTPPAAAARATSGGRGWCGCGRGGSAGKLTNCSLFGLGCVALCSYCVLVQQVAQLKADRARLKRELTTMTRELQASMARSTETERKAQVMIESLTHELDNARGRRYQANESTDQAVHALGSRQAEVRAYKGATSELRNYVESLATRGDRVSNCHDLFL